MNTGLNPRLMRTGALFILVAQACVIVVTVVSFWNFGSAFPPVGAAIITGLLLLNAGYLFQGFHLRQSQEASRRLRLLAEMNVQVNREILLNEDIELIYRTILDYLFRIFNTVTTGSILILHEDGYLRFAASRGFTEEYVQNFNLKLEDAFLYQDTGGAIAETRLITGETIARLITKFEPGDWTYNSVISAPLFVGNRLFGILNLDSDRTGVFDSGDVDIVERFRAQIEVGLLARERYRSNIERYHVDALTGLFTRRYFEDLFSVTLERAQRYGESFVMAMFDVDRLKYVNDTYGHIAGDQMLLSIANALRTSCRKSDIIGRFGGDEFIAVYPVAEMAKIDKSIAQILSTLRSTSTSFAEKERLLSFCYGLARYPDDGNDLQTLTAKADQRLYAMKSERKRT